MRAELSQSLDFTLVRSWAESPATPSLNFGIRNWELKTGCCLTSLSCGTFLCSNGELVRHISPTHPTPTSHTAASIYLVYSLPIPLLLSREVNGLLLLFTPIKSRATWHWEDIWIRGGQWVLGVLGMVGVPRVWRVRSVGRELSSLGLWWGRHDAATRATQATASG